MVTMENEKVLTKIQKLLALSEGTHSQEEAQSAMMKAQELLLANGLTMTDINKNSNVKPEVDHNMTEIRKPRMPWYWSQIAGVVAENFKCHLYIANEYDYERRETVKRICLIGIKEDVEVAITTIQFALSTADSCWNAWKRKENKIRKAMGRKNVNIRAKNDYMLGFITGLNQCFKEQVTSMALVIVKDALVEKEYATMDLRTTHSRPRINGDSAAKTQGAKDGRMAKKDSYIQ